MTKNICFTETKPKTNSEIIGISLWSPSSLDYIIWVVLENKTNATSHPNIKTAVEKKWNKMSEEFILKACKSFRRCVDTIVERKKKKKKKKVAILGKFTVLCLSSNFVVYFLKLKLI